MTDDLISVMIAFVCSVAFTVLGISFIKSNLDRRFKCKLLVKALIDDYEVTSQTSVNGRLTGRYGHRYYKYTIDGIEYRVAGNGSFNEKNMNVGKETYIKVCEDNPELMTDKPNNTVLFAGICGVIIGVIFLMIAALWMHG